MAKVNLTKVSSGHSSASQINANSKQIETAFDNTVSRDGSAPNNITSDLNLGGKKAINAAAGSSATDLVNKAQIDALTTNSLTGYNANTGTFLPAGYTNQTIENKLKESISVKDYGAVGDGTTDDTLSIQTAIDALPTNSILFFPAGIYKVVAPATATENHFNKIASLFTSHIALELKAGNNNITFYGPSAELKLLSTNNASEISFIIGNKKAVTPDNITFNGLSFDLDQTTNSSSEQARGGLFIGATNLSFENCTFRSSSAKGGFALDIMNCTNISTTSSKFRNISGGEFFIYSSSINISSCIFNNLNECVDLDKQNNMATIAGNTFYNTIVTGQVLDINSTSNVSFTGNTCTGFGTGVITTVDKLLSDTFDNHITGTSTAWRTSKDIVISSNTFVNCGADATQTFITIGNSWTTDATRNIVGLPPTRINIENNVGNTLGQIFVLEALDLSIKNNNFSRIVTTTSAGQEYFILASSENDFTTFPLAEANSGLSCDISSNTFDDADGGIIKVSFANNFVVNNNILKNHDVASQSREGLYLFGLDVRNTKGYIFGNIIETGFVGLRLHTSAPGTSKVKVLHNKIRNHSSFDIIADLTGLETIIEAEEKTIHLGTIAATFTGEIPLFPANSNLLLFRALGTVSSSVTQDDTDYMQLEFKNRNQLGSVVSLINSVSTKLTGGLDLVAFRNVDFTGLIIDADRVIPRTDEGSSVTCLVTSNGIGQALNDLSLTLRYISY